MINSRCTSLLPLAFLAAAAATIPESIWREVESDGHPHPRHEHAFVGIGDKFYALGGRRIQPVDIFDPGTKSWTTGRKPPLELHHFQAVEWDGKVLVAGAMTGKFPAETPVGRFYYYDPEGDAWSAGPEIPEARRRGSAGAFVRDKKLYLVSGLTDGHRSGWVPWFDEYDFATETWRVLPDAPRARDHFQAVVIGGEVVLAGGRRSGEGGSVFASVIKDVDIFNFESGTWRTLERGIPTARAGTMALAVGGNAVVIGGESARKEAHAEVEALELATGTWQKWAPLPGGRHATQPVLFEDMIYLQAGSITRGGTETATMIALPVSKGER